MRPLIVLLMIIMAGLVPRWTTASAKIHLRPPLWLDADDRSIPEPKERRESELYAIVYNSWLRHLSPEYKARQAFDPGALNVNAWDGVPNSTWFNNRLGGRTLTFEELVAGLEGRSPEPGAWTVVRIIDEGYTPKVEVLDPARRRYALKFDLPAALERNSAAERIGTLVMHGAGYNVPHNSIVYFRAQDLALGKDAYYRDSVGKRRKLTQADLSAALARLKALPDGRYRGLASLFLPEKAVGRFIYTGRRKDDSNDVIPHELRRELRGMRVIASWINHVDVGDKNALDIYVAGRDGHKFVKHYLLDFGSCLGSGDFINGPYRVGHEYIFDGSSIGRSFFTLGAWRRPWEVRGEIRYAEVGYYQAELFAPEKWKPNYPNLSFERMDDGDAYWGARIVTAFSDGIIQRLAAAGEYSRPEVADYVDQVLKKRRDAIGRYWLDRVSPLEDFVLTREGRGLRLSFKDLAVERGYANADSRTYRFWIEDAAGKKVLGISAAERGKNVLELQDLPAGNASGKQAIADRFGRRPAQRVLIQSNRRDGGWALPVEVILGFGGKQPEPQVLGWYHAPHQ